MLDEVFNVFLVILRKNSRSCISVKPLTVGVHFSVLNETCL